MQLPINIGSEGKAGLQRQLVDQVRELISRGILKPGARLPSTREMATDLNISRRTVVLSYERMITDGLIVTRPGLGTFVCDPLPSEYIRIRDGYPDAEVARLSFARFKRAVDGMHLYQEPRDRLRYDFRIGRPDPGLFPRNLWRRLTVEHLDTFTRLISDYTDPAGHPLLREAIANHLRTARGILCKPEQVVVTAGAQEGLNLVARLMEIRDKQVVVEDPCYRGAAQAFSSLGAQLVPVPIGDDGLDTDMLPKDGGCVGYVTPSHQFPLGVTMSRERRLNLVEWARHTGTLLVEDDYDSDFRHNSTPLIALQALAPECVVYLGTFSKSIGPGLRLGYAVFPHDLAKAARCLKSVMNNGHPWLEQSVTADFISSGAFEQHLSRMRTCYLERRNTVMECIGRAFPATSLSGFEGGMHLVWTIESDFGSASDLKSKCQQIGVGVYTLNESPTHQLHPRLDGERKILLGYPCLNPQQIQTAIGLIQHARYRTNLLATAPFDS
ncbi:PLP-dependent aminotransferase family protein [Bradyrhizobium sp. I71]|uniref:MocR-like pyridoxine biosynthesis transcription factor PdxR n=1 Tax=Bradyrhizobium sp. I71 TaxID=2590772 RepID=UPI001EF8C00C|nr:PLP-dependent aminotransferase family protein [Bradyrhizobium sp. I71]ULK95036.1 PLP-dependent aminotransferase family protein [Bradyrhizobium sp. I71]